jgi:hypothetical protein
MKAQAKIVDIVGVIATAVIIVVFLAKLPEIIKGYLDLLALHHPEALSRELASLISISAASPEDIKLTYKLEIKGITYDVQVQNRNVTVLAHLNGDTIGPAWDTCAVDNLNADVKRKIKFLVTKSSVGNDYILTFEGVG